MNDIIKNESTKIEDMIYEIRSKQVMLDSDLASLYEVETKRINEAVKRNINKFPERFSWTLDDEESKQFLVAKCDQKIETRGGKYKNPRVFTEQGIAMLATVLKSERAINTSISIMDAFVTMREYISTNLIEQKYINSQVLKNTEDIKMLQETFKSFRPAKNHIFFEGQIYDAYSLLLDIFESSEETIIIVDNYADKRLLDLLSKTDKKIKVYSRNMDEELVKKYNLQYKNVTIIQDDNFHDRFIIIDNKILYHCGASFKELGKKCFSINRIEDKELIDKLLENLNKENC